MTVSSSDPPLGPPVPGWLPRQPPPLEVISGRFCRVEPIDSTRHGAALYDAYATDRDLPPIPAEANLPTPPSP